MKVSFVLGTRPEIIKLSPLIRQCQENQQPYCLIHTNQHYSENMDRVFFEELELNAPHYNLGIGSGAHGEQTGRMMQEIERVLEKEQPDVLLVQGDTNSVLAGALVAAKLPFIKVGHVEAGLRSYDWSMPEEINRIATDHISDFLFPPTAKQSKILKKEGISSRKIFEVGNTIVDAVLQNREIAKRKATVLSSLNLIPNRYILLTAHRPANVDSPESFQDLLHGVGEIADMFSVSVIFPIHPRTKKNLETFNLSVPSSIRLIDPVGYLDMLQLQEQAFMILTDSGGVQEEACILEKKCLTLRENTERPETVEVGGNILTGVNPKKMLNGAQTLVKKDIVWYNPFGKGDSSRQILSILEENL